MAQMPMISIPKKTTEEVDWTTPIRDIIAHSYGESPDNYAAECAALQRCRQDAVRGTRSDMTACDLFYKYFGQLELLEPRFSGIRVNFPWHDAFTSKLITQTSISYEKASILFQIAVTHSAIATSQRRSDFEGLKRAFYYFRTCAGMLSYIKENFLHAPSTDLSREVVKFLIGLVLAQATEVFFETIDANGSVLAPKIATQAAGMYTSLNEQVEEFMGKGIFDRNWVTLIQIKSKYYSSLAQYHWGLSDNECCKHGDALARFRLSESLAKEAHKSSTSFSTSFVSNLSPNLPPDSGSSMLEKAKAHLVMCTDRKNEAHRENDMIYNVVVPVPEALAAIDKLVVAMPISMHDVYGSPKVQKAIGQGIFIRLVPLSLHESASVYSEEKAKCVRAEVENAESAGVARSALDGLGVTEGLVSYKAMADGSLGGEEEVTVDVSSLQQPPAPYSVSSPAPGPSPYTQYPTHKPTPPPSTSSPPRSSFFPPLPPSFSSMSQSGQDPYANLGELLGKGSYTPIRQPAGQSVPPQPPSGQDELPLPLGQSVLPPRLPTMANLDRRQPPPHPTFPAAVLPVLSPPSPPQQPQQQRQEYVQRPQIPNQFNQFVGHESLGLRNRRNSEWSQATGVSDETHLSLKKSKNRFLFH